MAEKKKFKINLGTFDLVKGIAIFSVVFSHSIIRYPIDQFPLLSPLYFIFLFLGSGLMPMFFIISGYALKTKPAIKRLKKSASELIVPYLIVIPISILFFGILHWVLFYSKSQLLECMGKMVSSFLLCTDLAGPLWFFLALFIAENILNLIVKLKKTSVQVVMVVFCVIMGFTIMQCKFTYFRIVEGLTAIGFCYVGYLLRDKKLLERILQSVWTYIVLIPVCLMQFLSAWQSRLSHVYDLQFACVWDFLNGGIGLNMGTANFSVFGYLAGGCSGLLFLLIGVLCSRLKWKGLDWLKNLGMQSYWILVSHTVEYTAFPWYELAQESPSIYITFVIEAGLKILTIMIGCEIFKKISHIKYRRRMKQIENARYHERVDHKVCQ